MQSLANRVVLLGLALILVTGCNSSGRAPESKKAVSTMQDVYGSLGKATAQVNRTTALLDQLAHGESNLEPTFKQYTESVADLKEAGDKARARGKEMREKRQEYLATWEKEAADIHDPAVKEAVDERQARVRSNYDNIATLADDVRGAYEPFLRHAQDVQRALSLDLTPAGVKAIAAVIESTKKDGEALSKKLDALGVELNKVMGKMSPSGKM